MDGRDGTGCDYCTYTVCIDCVGGIVVGDYICANCQSFRAAGFALDRLRMVPTRLLRDPDGRECTRLAVVSDASRARADLQKAALAFIESKSDLILPRPVFVKGKVDDWVVPTMPLSRGLWDAAGSLRRLRLIMLAAIPVKSAQALMSAWEMFDDFLQRIVGVTWDAVDPEVVADFIVWRTCGTDEIPVAAPPRQPYVSLNSALSSLALIRRAVQFTRVVPVDCLYGEPIRAISRRLRTESSPDSVRKTPIPVDQLKKICEAAWKGDYNLERAAICALGVCFFLRVGEVQAIEMADVSIRKVNGRRAVCMVFRAFKAAGGRTKKAQTRPIHRVCHVGWLVRTMEAFLRSVKKKGDDLLFAFKDPQKTLRAMFGTPPVLPGEAAPLPWSLRAAGATYCFQAGLSLPYIQRLGRWRSEVGALYCILTPSIQGDCWDAVEEDFPCEPDGE